MKAHIIIAASSILLCSTACKKNISVAPTTNTGENIEQRTISSNEVIPLISDFKKIIKEGQNKTDFDLSKENVLGALEASLNYDFDKVDATFELNRKKINYDLNLSDDGRIKLNELQLAYNYFSNQIKNSKESNEVKVIDATAKISSNTKVTISIDIVYANSVPSSFVSKVNPCSTITVSAIWTAKYPNSGLNYDCSSVTTNYGPDLCNARLNCLNSQNSNSCIGGSFYTNVMNSLISNYYNDKNFFYFENGHNISPCSVPLLSSTDLNWYVTSAISYATTYKPIGKQIINYSYTDAWGIVTGQFWNHYHWNLSISYGTLNCYPTPPPAS